MDPNIEKLEEMYRLVKENNRMLHKMRRNAFFGGIVKVIVWAALLGVPIWLYFTYLFPVMQNMLDTFEQIQGTGANAQAQFGDLQDAFKKFDPSQYFGQ